MKKMNKIKLDNDDTLTNIPIKLIKDFPNHPFKVRDDEKILDIHKVKSVTTGKVKPTNYFTLGVASKIKTADYERDAYIIYCSDDDDLTNITGYVDMYTGKVIGGFYGGV